MISRRVLLLLPAALVARAAADRKDSIRGRLRQDEHLPPAIITREGRTVVLEGDAPSEAVLRDPRLAKEDFEAVGHYRAPDVFVVDPIHERALFVWRNGKRLVVTYWCDVCSIRAWSPGKCQCCQQEMRLDLRDPALGDMDLK
ncbi:MAG: hypothetical protein KatS3mg004_2070 [Bryobacteraceae bacterium]|nr:MAG: hypothetical protein KatS3mg004_2070 [Bryobacteraceae bacterium]